MRKFLLVMAALLPAVAAFAEQPRIQKSDKAATPAKLLPLKGAASAGSCAEYGAGFVRVEGSNSCVKVGGATRVETGVSTGSR